MSENTGNCIKSSHILLAAIALSILTAAAFSLGMAYEKFNSRFTWHEIPLKSGGIAFIVPERWQVVTEWDRHGRPYIKPSDED